MPEFRQTRFSDVCGTVDEFKRMLHEGEDSQSARRMLVSYVEDCLFMIERMQLRLEEFQSFRDGVLRLGERLQRIPASRHDEAIVVGQAMRQRLVRDANFAESEREELCRQAEAVRQVAGELEQLLRRYKEAAMELGALYGAIEGGRGWRSDSAAAAEAGLRETLAAWLPPEPHRVKVLDFIRRGRAWLLPGEKGETPLVQFEDGGVIALSAVRWSEAVGNFVPASFDPSPRAARYRPRED